MFRGTGSICHAKREAVEIRSDDHHEIRVTIERIGA